MPDADTGRFTVGVFQDVAWARRGVDALLRAGIAAEALSVIARDGADVATLIATLPGGEGERLDIAGIGSVLTKGPLTAALQGPNLALVTQGLSGTMGRVGFQSHDSRIFERLTERGGVLVAVHSEPRAADALAVLLSHGGGNAAIGAWTGRL